MFGIPTRSQRSRVERVAREALDLLRDAESRLATEISKLESQLIDQHAFSADRARDAEDRLARLVDVEQAQRVPLLRGRSLALLACAGEGPPRTESVAAAEDLLAPLRLGNARAEHARTVYLAAAMLRRTSVDDQARATAQRLLESASSDLVAGPSRLARMGLLYLGAPGTPPPAPALTEREAVARRMVEQARADSTRRASLLRQACEQLLEVPHDDDTARVSLYAKLAVVAEVALATSELPAEAAFARAVTLLRESESSAEASTILRQLNDRPDVPEPIRPQVAWENIVLLSRATDRSPDDLASSSAEVDALIAFTTRFGTHPLAATAERRLLGLIESTAWRTPAGLAAYQQRASRLDPLCERAFEREPTPTRAVSALSRRLAALPGDPSEARVESLLRVVALVPEPTRATAAASVRHALAAIVRPRVDASVGNVPSAAGDGGLARAVDRAYSTLPGETPPSAALDVADLLARSSATSDTSDTSATSDTNRAIAIYRSLAAGGEPRAVLGLASLQRRRGESTSAIQTLRTMVDRLDASAIAPRPPHYWLAWAEIVEMMHAQRAAELLGQIKRLELIDPGLGAGSEARRILAVKRALEN